MTKILNAPKIYHNWFKKSLSIQPIDISVKTPFLSPPHILLIPAVGQSLLLPQQGVSKRTLPRHFVQVDERRVGHEHVQVKPLTIAPRVRVRRNWAARRRKWGRELATIWEATHALNDRWYRGWAELERNAYHLPAL